MCEPGTAYAVCTVALQSHSAYHCQCGSLLAIVAPSLVIMIVGQITLLPPTSDPGPPAGPVHVLLPLAAGVWHRDTGTQSHWHGTHSVLARARGCSEFFLKGQWRLAGLDCPVPSLDTPTGGRCAHGAQFGPPITDLLFLGPSPTESGFFPLSERPIGPGPISGGTGLEPTQWQLFRDPKSRSTPNTQTNPGSLDPAPPVWCSGGFEKP